MDVYYVNSEVYFDMLEKYEKILLIFIKSPNFEKTKDYQKVLDFCKTKEYNLGIINLEESEDLFNYFNIKKDKTFILFEERQHILRGDLETLF